MGFKRIIILVQSKELEQAWQNKRKPDWKGRTILENIQSFLSQGIHIKVQSVPRIILGDFSQIIALAKMATNFPMHYALPMA